MTRFGWGKGGNVTSAGWQITLCDTIWHVSSRSGVGVLRCKLLYPLPLPSSTLHAKAWHGDCTALMLCVIDCR